MNSSITNGITLRYDEGRKEYVINLEVKGLRSFEATGNLLSDAFEYLAAQLENEGI